VGEVSVKDVAKHAGVSLGTVSNVLNRPEIVREATREKVLAAIEELGFVRNDAARQLREGRSRSIGLIVLDSTNPFFTELARGAERAALERGHTLVLGNSDNSSARERDYLDLFEQQRVFGVLIVPAHASPEQAAEYAERGLRTVLVDRAPDPGSGLEGISVDDVEGGRLAVRHLLDGGRRRVLFLAGPLGIRQVSQRLEGARAAIAEADGEEPPTFRVLEGPEMTIEAGRALGAQALDAGLEFDAIFASNDLLAIGFMREMRERGLSVPEDAAVVGYDDIPYAAMLQMPLTSIRQPAAQIGAAAVELLLGPAADTGEPNATMFKPEIVVRASSGPAV